MTDTVGFIQKLPTHLIAAFRATLEEIVEADILLHVTDISSETWLKQELAVREELQLMGLTEKPLITVWNKVDSVAESIEVIEEYAKKRSQTVAISAKSGYGLENLLNMMEDILSKEMKNVVCYLRYDRSSVRTLLHRLGKVEQETFGAEEIEVHAKIPHFLFSQLQDFREDLREDSSIPTADGYSGIKIIDLDFDANSSLNRVNPTTPILPKVTTKGSIEDIDWKALAKGRHS